MINIQGLVSKKLLVVLLAYSVIVLDGTGLLTLDELVVQAAAGSLITFIAAQGAVDFQEAKPTGAAAKKSQASPSATKRRATRS